MPPMSDDKSIRRQIKELEYGHPKLILTAEGHDDVVPTFWEGFTDREDPMDTFKDAWNQFRKFGYSDLQPLRDRLFERFREAHNRTSELERKELPDGDLLERVSAAARLKRDHGPLYNAKVYYHRRAKAAGALMRYIEECGPPPRWEDLTDEEQDQARPRNTFFEIAECILAVHDEQAAEDWTSRSQFLQEVDEKRGVGSRTTYRYLSNNLGEVPNLDQLPDWARETLPGLDEKDDATCDM